MISTVLQLLYFLMSLYGLKSRKILFVPSNQSDLSIIEEHMSLSSSSKGGVFHRLLMGKQPYTDVCILDAFWSH